jgi:HhH-GPD superfamily base excision DNA repair protein/SnoaL-like domain
VFQVAGQQLSVSSTRAIVSHLQQRFGGHLPSPAELLAADPQVLRQSGFSARKGQTLRALAERFVDGRLSDEALARMTDDEVEATLTEVPGIGLWTARGFLLVALDRPDVFLSGDLALRRAIQRASDFDHLPNDDELAQVSDRWRPYRSPCSELPVRVRIRGATVTDHAELSPTEAADRLALRELFDAYAHCADRRDAEGQKALFSDDTVFAVYMDGEGSEPTYVLRGREALTPVFEDLNRYEVTTHFNGQSSITLDVTEQPARATR